MQEIADWLAKLGMSEYAERFAENRIDFSVLSDLTDQDLEKIGVVLGDRRKLLRAIAGLVGGEKADTQRTAVSADSASAVRPHGAAERRQVTVMFSDLVGSTALSARMDPEDLGEIISSYQRCVADTVQRFGGFVAKYMGDGVLVYFGYPQAHEDDAERAVRAGLELITAVSGLRAASPLQTRVGIATGVVVVGDLVGMGEAQERGIVVRRRTSRPVCKASLSRTWLSSAKPRENLSAICLICKSLEPKTSKASRGRYMRSRHCGRVWWQAASRRCGPRRHPSLVATRK